jgi:peptide/nickel transport system permease protein
MYTILIRRLLILPLILLLTSVAIFLLPYLAGIDPTLSIIRARIGERTLDPAAVEQLRNDLGLDRSLATFCGATWVFPMSVARRWR